MACAPAPWVPELNVVCLIGHFQREPTRVAPARPGWASALLEVSRQGPGVEGEPGVVSVALLVPPRLAEMRLRRLRTGSTVAVIGMLDVDVDLSGATPFAHHVVIAQHIEAVGDASPTPFPWRPSE